MIDEGTILMRASNLSWNSLEDEIVILSKDSGQYYGLNKTAAIIWIFLDQPRTISQISRHVEELYSINPVQAQNDIELLVNKLLKRKLVILSA